MMLLLLRLFPDPQLETPPRPRDNFYEPEHPYFGRLFLLGPVSPWTIGGVLTKVKQTGRVPLLLELVRQSLFTSTYLQ
jgi:hypothetical protein